METPSFAVDPEQLRVKLDRSLPLSVPDAPSHRRRYTREQTRAKRAARRPEQVSPVSSILGDGQIGGSVEEDDILDPDRCHGILQGRRGRKRADARCKNTAEPDGSGFCHIHNRATAVLGNGREARKTLQKYESLGRTLRVSPITAMLSLIHECAGNVEYYRNKVTELERLTLRGKRETEEVMKIVVLYNEERDRLQRYVTDAMRVGIDLKQVRLYELQSQAIVQVVRAVVDATGVTGPLRSKVLAIGADHLRAFTQQQSGWGSPYTDIDSDKLVEHIAS
jgi:hypothetical protein